MRSRRRTTAPPARAELSATWWEGVHITGTPVWCDARRARDVCFVSHASAADAVRHGQLIGSRQTLALLARTDRRRQPQAQLAVPFNRPFTLGELRFELFRSGRGLGGASLLVELDGTRVVYAGRVNPHGGGLAGEADLRRADVLIIDAHYGHPRFDFPAVDEVREQVLDFATGAMRAGEVPVLVVTSPTKALDVAHQLANAGPALRAHRAIHHAAQKLRADGEPLPRIKRWDGKLRHGEAVLWLADDPRLPRRDGDGPEPHLALISGDALDGERIDALGVENGFAWSDSADYGELLRYIEATGAARVYVTGRHAESLAARVGDLIPLRPARQLALF